jgi:hypothetical protein
VNDVRDNESLDGSDVHGRLQRCCWTKLGRGRERLFVGGAAARTSADGDLDSSEALTAAGQRAWEGRAVRRLVMRALFFFLPED